MGRYNGRTDDRIRERFKQYLIECEGEGPEPEEDLDEVFATLAIDYKTENEQMDDVD